MNILLMLGLTLALFMSCVTTVSAATTIYTDKTAWESALGGQFLTEDFTDIQLNTGVSFVANTSSGHINPETITPTGTAGGYYTDVMASTNPNDPSTTWNFTPEIIAYGGDWHLGGGGGSGNSLLVYIDDFSLQVGSINSSYVGGFWGFISDVAFTSVNLIGAGGSNQQTYTLDNMVYSPVPVPATVWLFCSGILSLVGFARRKTT